MVSKYGTNILVNVIHKHRNDLLLLLKYRAFEERQKEEEAKEQRFREKVLQQRKIKFQEATAKFRHAHQSLSPHRQTGLSIKNQPLLTIQVFLYSQNQRIVKVGRDFWRPLVFSISKQNN